MTYKTPPQGGVYAELPELVTVVKLPNGIDGNLEYRDVWSLDEMRDFADRTHALRAALAQKEIT